MWRSLGLGLGLGFCSSRIEDEIRYDTKICTYLLRYFTYPLRHMQHKAMSRCVAI